MTRIQPHNVTAEQAVIGAALHNPLVIDQIAVTIEPTAFYRPAHQIIWQTLTQQREAGLPCDPITIADLLLHSGDLNRIGGASYLHTCMAAVPTAANASHYAAIINEAHRSRVVVEIGTRLVQAGSLTNETDSLIAHGRAWLETIDRPDTWPDPIPLGSGHSGLPAFPLDALPDWVADMAGAVAMETQTPPDLAGSIALAALSAAACGRITVRVRGAWTEPVNIYTVVALPPGSRKTAVFASLTRPLYQAESALAQAARPAILEAELTRKIAQARAEKSANTATTSTSSPEALAEAIDAAMTADTIDIPASPVLVADDITPEAISGTLAEQAGRLAILSDEGGIFATIAGRYTGTPNLDALLKGHAGSPLRVHRRGRGPEVIESPALTLGLAVQPHVLIDAARQPGFRDRGLLARILYSLPHNTVGTRRPGSPAVPTEVAIRYQRNLETLVFRAHPLTEPITIPLSPEADQAILALENAIEPRLNPDGGMWAHITDWASKLTGATVRLAGLIHLGDTLGGSAQQPISASTIAQATKLANYYARHALTVFDAMTTSPTISHAQTLLDWLHRTKPERFTRRDAMAATSRSRFPTVKDLDEPLTLLEQHGYIRSAPAPPRRGRGRPPSPAYHPHPSVLDHQQVPDRAEAVH